MSNPDERAAADADLQAREHAKKERYLDDRGGGGAGGGM
jgi:hypothetical protein